MPITSLIVQIEECCADAVTAAVARLEGVQVLGRSPGRLALLTETDRLADDRALWEAVQGIPGVLGLGLVYHCCDDTGETAP